MPNRAVGIVSPVPTSPGKMVGADFTLSFMATLLGSPAYRDYLSKDEMEPIIKEDQQAFR